MNDIDYGTDRIIIGNSRSVLDYESYADNLDASLTIYPEGGQLDLYVAPRLNGYQNVYRELYEKIRNCNLIIENMKDQDTELGKDILATSYALRGVFIIIFYDGFVNLMIKQWQRPSWVFLWSVILTWKH